MSQTRHVRNRISAASAALALAFAIASSGCGDQDPGALITGPDREGTDLSTIVLAITTVPTDVQCVRVVVTGSQTVTRTFDVTPGQSANLAMTGLPVGNVTVYEETFSVGCAMVAANTPASWVSDAPVAVTLVSGQQASITVVLRRPSGLQITTDFQGGTGVLSLAPTSRDFGNVTVGGGSTATTFTVSNGTGSSLMLTATLTGANAADFAITSNTCASVVAGGTCALQVHFAPRSVGSRTATLNVASQSGTVVAALAGTGTSALGPTSRDFGGVTVGGGSTTTTFTVTNATGSTVMVATSLTGANTAEFAITSNACASGIGPGQTCTLLVHFAPRFVGPRAATLNVVGPSWTATAALTGTGVSALSPTSRDFGGVAVGSGSMATTFTVTNATGSTVMFATSTSGANAAEFPITSNTCGSSVAPGGTCTLQVHFAPSATGARSATLTVGTATWTATAALTGTGTGGLRITPTSFDFGSATVGGGSPPTILTVTNTTDSMAMVTTTLAGANAAEFAVASNMCAGGVAAGATCTMQVHFAPRGVGARTATLNVTSQAGAATAALTGTGISALSPTSRDFGSVPAGSGSMATTFTVTNATGSTMMFTTSVTGANAAEFPVTANTCASGVAPGGTCTLQVHFAPSAGAVGVRTATLNVGTSTWTATAALSGTAAAGTSASLSPSSVNFGNTAVGGQSGALQLTLANTSMSAFQISPVSLSGANTADFRIVSNACIPGATLMPQQTCSVTVSFAPTGAGSRTATLAHAMPSASAALSGTGVAWTSQDVGAVAATGSSSQMGSIHTVRGSGADIWGGADEFRYVFQSVTGDATITARVSGIQNTNAWAKIGIMMREGTAANARNVFAFVTPDPANRYRFQSRSTAGGSTSPSSAGAGTTPAWLRLVRRGAVITGSFSSTMGMSWTQIGTATTMLPGTINVGLAVTSHADGTINTSTFDNVTITQP